MSAALKAIPSELEQVADAGRKGALANADRSQANWPKLLLYAANRKAAEPHLTAEELAIETWDWARRGDGVRMKNGSCYSLRSILDRLTGIYEGNKRKARSVLRARPTELRARPGQR